MYLMGKEPEVQDPGAGRHWHALYTRHQHEKPIARILSNKGHEVFLPLCPVTHRWRDRTKQLWLPLFPCYVFIQGGLDRQLQILNTPGVFAIVGWTGHPAMIPNEEIEAVRQMVESSIRVEPHPYLNCGDPVRVISGPLQGLTGILTRKKNLFRLVVSVEMLGRSAAVEIDISCLERLACISRKGFAISQQCARRNSSHAVW
jgi:transcription antitermination factor NusG